MLTFGVFRRQNIAESTNFRVALSAGEKNVVDYEKQSKLEWAYIQRNVYPSNFVKGEGGSGSTEGSQAKEDSNFFKYNTPSLLEVSFGDVSKNKSLTPIYRLSLLR